MRNKNVTDEQWSRSVNTAARGAHEAFRAFVMGMEGERHGSSLAPWLELTQPARDAARVSAEKVMTGENSVMSFFEEVVMMIAGHMGVLEDAPHHHEPCPACGDPGPERYGPAVKPKSPLTNFLEVVFQSVGKGIAAYAEEKASSPVEKEDVPPADPELEKTMDELQDLGVQVCLGQLKEEWISAHVADLCERHGPERVRALDLLFENAKKTGFRAPTSSTPGKPPTT